MKRKAFLAFGVILVFAILAIPKSIAAIETQAVIEEVACLIELSLQKLLEQLRSFVLQQ
jgi:hypothetical protein